MRLTAASEPNPEARNGLIEDHIGLVKTLAARLARRIPGQVEVTELVSVGMVGLVDAARRYQPALGVPFDAFARRRIHGAMLDALRALDWAPRSVRKMRRDLDGTLARLRHTLKREPTEEEVAADLGLSDEAYRRMLDQVRALDLASVRHREGYGRETLDVAIDPDEGQHARLERSELREHLARAIAGLPDRERRVLALYYEHELTLAEIGEVIGVGESRVSQIRTQAVARLRGMLRETLQLSEMS